jgi:hypothetical protein
VDGIEAAAFHQGGVDFFRATVKRQKAAELEIPDPLCDRSKAAPFRPPLVQAARPWKRETAG